MRGRGAWCLLAGLVPAALHGQAMPPRRAAGFDTSAAVVSLARDATPITTLWSRWARSARGTTETTAAYDRRIRAMADTTWAVVLDRPNEDCATWRLAYDADRERLTVTVVAVSPEPCRWEDCDAYGDAAVAAIRARCVRRPAGSYLGRNRFGQTMRVTRDSLTIYALALPDAQVLRALPPTAELRVPRAEADGLMRRLRVVAAFQPTATGDLGVAQERTAVTTPRAEAPLEVVLTARYLTARWVRFLVVDERSGRVLARLPVTPP